MALNCIIGGLIGGIVVIIKIFCIVAEFLSTVMEHFWTKKWKYRTSGQFVQKQGSQNVAALFLSITGGKIMESMREVDRVMEREIKREVHRYSLNSWDLEITVIIRLRQRKNCCRCFRICYELESMNSLPGKP